MRAITLVALPLAVLPMPAPNSLTPRDIGKTPYVVDNNCPDLQIKKMLVAAKTARSLATDVISQWWDNGQHTEIAVTYLAIPDDGTYTVNQWAHIVRDNLQTVAKLDGVVPVFGSHLTATCQVDDTCKFSDISGNVAGYAETYDSHFCPIWVRDYKPKTEDAVKNADSYTQFLKRLGAPLLQFRAFSQSPVLSHIHEESFRLPSSPTRATPMAEKNWCMTDFGFTQEYAHKTITERNIQVFCSKLIGGYHPHTSGNFSHEYWARPRTLR
jgi:hypothetical protein